MKFFGYSQVFHPQNADVTENYCNFAVSLGGSR